MPSYMYSLVRGRLPLIRGNSDGCAVEPGGKATPGASAISGTKLRPSKGRVATFSWFTTKFSVPVVVCNRDAPLVTSTDCVTSPTCN